MPALFEHADALREYLTGAASDGGAQSNPSASLGNYRSSTEAVSLGITINNAIAGVSVLYAGGLNGPGVGTLTATDATHLQWQAPGDSSAGAAVTWSGTQTQIVESATIGAYLRITATAPFTPGTSQITLAVLYNNQFGMDNVTATQASAGLSQYRASMVRNESGNPVTNFQRYIGQLGTARVSDTAVLGASGAGTITTSGSFADWPASGWCQIETSGGSLREVVYYSSRTITSLTVPSWGRALLGTAAAAGSITDNIYATPGVAIAIDTAGVQASGNLIQTIASQTTAPASVTWNLGLTPATGLQIGTMSANTEVGIWVWRQIPAGAIAVPSDLDKFLDLFNAV